jgi:hypothetical protein
MGPSVGISSPILAVDHDTEASRRRQSVTLRRSIGTSNPVTTGGVRRRPHDDDHPGRPPAIEQVVAVTARVEAGTGQRLRGSAAPIDSWSPTSSSPTRNDSACGASVAGSRAGDDVAAPPTGPLHPTHAHGPAHDPRRHRTRPARDDERRRGSRQHRRALHPGADIAHAGADDGTRVHRGQSVLLGNQASTGRHDASGPLFYHLRGFLISGVVMVAGASARSGRRA